MTAETSFLVKSWDEETAHELAGGAKITRARVTQEYSGYVRGEATVEYVMYHRGDGTAVFAGIERIVGHVGGKSGSFVLQHHGVYEGGSARSESSVVAGSGTGDLEGLSGSGSFVVGHDMKGQVSLDLHSA